MSDIVEVINLIKLNDKQRNEIITRCKLDTSKENIKQIALDYNITTRYIYKLIKSDASKEIEKEINSITANGNEFTKKANEIINLLFQRIEDEIKNGEKISLSQLSTTLGILYDKSRLENNLSTENKAIQINISIEK